jgi:hypothetical protein
MAATSTYRYSESDLAPGGIIRKHFASPQQFADFLEDATTDDSALSEQGSYRRNRYRASYVHTAKTKGIQLLRDGDASLVARAKEIMSALTVVLPTTRAVRRTSIAGSRVNVPAYLAGLPKAFYATDRKHSDTTPVRIWVNVLPSGGCSRDQLLKRGAVISALVMRLSKTRLVSLTAYADQPASDGKGTVVSWNIPTAPMNLAQLCASLSQPDLVQGTCMYASAVLNTRINGGWLRGHCPAYGYNETLVRSDLGASQKDVVLPALYLTDDCINNPVQWIERELSRINGEAS